MVLVTTLVSGAAATTGARSLRLPNLRPLAPVELFPPQTEVLPFSQTTVVPFVIDGCLPEEIARAGARRCLRFDTRIVNEGRGPLEVTYLIDGPNVTALQRIYRHNGSYVERVASTSEFHPTHTHFHIKDFYVSRLWRLGSEGAPTGDPVATTLKNGFCPQDSEPYASSADRRYECRSEYETEDGVRQIVGISSGWMDTYGYQLPDQYVEISSVPSGRYLLEITIDPDDNFSESNERDNTVCVEVRLAGEEIQVGRTVSACNTRVARKA